MVAVFDTYEGEDFEKAVEKRIGEKVPALKSITSGLSIKVDGIDDPIIDDKLQVCVCELLLNSR